MTHSLKNLRANFEKYFTVFYGYMVKGIYYGLVPAVILYGKLFLRVYSKF